MDLTRIDPEDKYLTTDLNKDLAHELTIYLISRGVEYHLHPISPSPGYTFFRIITLNTQENIEIFELNGHWIHSRDYHYDFLMFKDEPVNNEHLKLKTD